MKDIKQVVAQLQKEGAEVVKNVVIKNVNIVDKTDYTLVPLTVNKNIKQMVLNDKGEYIEGERNIIFASLYSIGAILSNIEDIAFAKNLIIKNPNMLELVLSYAEIDIILEKVKKGAEYSNPFSSSDKTSIIANDSIFAHIIDIRLGRKGQKIVNKLEDKMMDMMIGGSFAANYQDTEETEE